MFDLGCGDGRIVVEAVRSFGAKRGVGVDIDPQRIKESRMTAAKAGVSDRVEFRQGDVLKEIDDLQEASVVMLYMGQHMNLRLKPILKKSVEAGSARGLPPFHDGRRLEAGKKPITVTDSSGEEYKLHLWTIK
ncbi:MAG: RNA methyltransferase [Gemmatales bacterium]|nr:MAG: RNA methyltransferase [Gemmatales bacterium]